MASGCVRTMSYRWMLQHRATIWRAGGEQSERLSLAQGRVATMIRFEFFPSSSQLARREKDCSPRPSA